MSCNSSLFLLNYFLSKLSSIFLYFHCCMIFTKVTIIIIIIVINTLNSGVFILTWLNILKIENFLRIRIIGQITHFLRCNWLTIRLIVAEKILWILLFLFLEILRILLKLPKAIIIIIIITFSMVIITISKIFRQIVGNISYLEAWLLLSLLLLL